MPGRLWGLGRDSLSGQCHDLPMNYYTAGDPDSMRDGAGQRSLQSIAAGPERGRCGAFQCSVGATSGANTYQGSHDATMWSGDVVASDRQGQC